MQNKNIQEWNVTYNMNITFLINTLHTFLKVRFEYEFELEIYIALIK